MPAFNKNFVVKHGLEVNANLLFANADNDRIGIGTTNPLNTLDVRGGIAATDVIVNGITTTTNLVVNGGFLRAAGSPGIVGQYLRSTGTGVEWASFPTLRTDDSFTAGIGQTLFSYAYTPGFLDVYVNGVKLNENEFTASNGTQVFLGAPCFGGEVVDFIGYNPTAVGAGATGILGITVKDQGVIIGNDNGVTSIDFVGTGINAVGTGAGVTVTFAADPGWAKTSTNVYTSLNVGIGTTLPRHSLHVVGVGSTSLFVDGDARVTGILSIGTSSITLDGNTNTLNIGSGVTISATTLTVPNLIVTNTSTIAGTAISVRDGVNNYSASVIDFGSNLTVDFSSGIATVNATGGGGGISTDSYWVGSASGIHTTSRVGVGTTNPTTELHVIGDSRISGVITAAQFIREGGSSTQFLKADGTSDPTTYLASNGDASGLINLTGVSSGTYGNSTAIPLITVDSVGRISSITTTPVSVGGGGGSGVNVYRSGSFLGFATDINFGSGITVSDWSAGIVTVTVSSSNYSSFSGVSTDVIGGIASVSQLRVTGISTLGVVTASNIYSTGVVTATSFVKPGGTSSQFLKADGTVDSSTYLTIAGSATSLTGLTGASSGTYGSSTVVPIITVNGNGRITGISTSAITGGGLSSMPSRVSVAGTTSSIAVGSTANITITGYKSYSLMKVGVSTAAWVVLYSDVDSRTSDASRSQTTDPSPGSGVIAEVITAGIGTVLITPSIVGWNNDSTPSTNIYAKVTNLGSTTQAVTVTLTILKLED